MKNRTGLNIVTDFAISPRRARMHGLIVDKVQSQRPRVKQKYRASIVSAKAEHLMHTEPFSPVPRLQEGKSNDNHSTKYNAPITTRDVSDHPRQHGPSALLTNPVSSDKRTLPTHHRNTQIFSGPETNMSHAKLEVANAQSPDSRSIVIGLSVPEHEAEAHAYHYAGDSALSMQTPDTPAIVVTPSDSPYDREVLKPSNGIPSNSKQYKASKTSAMEAISDSDTILALKHETAGATIVNDATFTRSYPSKAAQTHIDDSSEYETDTVGEADTRRFSSESKEQILQAPSPEIARHKSQGWWNLMLSPMISRKSTIKSLATHRASNPPLPSVPYPMDVSRSNGPFSAASDSPQTPRRLGIASARASVWSRWTTWEKTRDGVSPVDEKKDTSFEQFQNDAHQFRPGPPQPLISKGWGNGTAAEYYHACAVEQIDGTKYFECENHSCEEQLPKFRSIFDHQQKTGAAVLGQHQDEENQIDIGGRALPAMSNLHGPSSEDAVQVVTKMPSPTIVQSNAAPAPLVRPSEQPQAEDVKGQSLTMVKGVESNEAQGHVDSESRPPPSGSNTIPQDQPPKIATNVAAREAPPSVPSPGPVSPGMNRAMASQGAVPLTEVYYQTESQRAYGNAPGGQTGAAFQPVPGPIAVHHHFHTPEAPTNDATTSVRPSQPAEPSPTLPVARTIPMASSHPPEEAPAPAPASTKNVDENKTKSGFLAKLWCFGRKPKTDDAEAKTKKKNRRWAWLISILLLLIVIVCVLLALLLTRGGDGTPVQNEWLNLTGYPPMPTGISTIARPDLVKQQNQCVAPSTLWSCALPKENHGEIADNAPDQPNFRFQISFQNGTVPANMTIPVQELAKRALPLTRRASNPFSKDLFEPNPVPPSRADQIFMGNTTDNITVPFDGEKTPFFITIIPSFPIDPNNLNASATTTETSTKASRRLTRRQDSNGNVTIGLPPPDILDDGSAAPANLLPISPYPSAQPIKLYNRGLADEHYGFYMYYDKSIFLRSTAALDKEAFSDNNGIDAADEDGGSDRNQARLRCTLSQTRFLVKIWTNPEFGAELLVRLGGDGNNATATNSATDFSRPGSFPYPATLSIDRHGGNINKKGAYCYGVDPLQVIQDDVKSLIPELRSVGGPGLVNPAPSLINSTETGDDGDGDGFSQSAGGIDGGVGGCECVWQNWN